MRESGLRTRRNHRRAIGTPPLLLSGALAYSLKVEPCAAYGTLSRSSFRRSYAHSAGLVLAG